MRENRKKLIDVMHQADETNREVMYWGLAYGVVTTVLSKTNLNINDAKVAIKDVVNELAELAIIDRIFLEKTIINVYSYFNISKLNVNFESKVYTSKSMEDALYINEFIGQQTLETVNSNIELFNRVVKITNAYSSEIKEYSKLLK